jgi:hypothetical protein
MIGEDRLAQSLGIGIVCLGWGSLIWCPKDLPIEGGWHSDGPELPVEFARQSSGKRITLVLVPGRTRVRVLWARLQSKTVDEAIRALASREGTPRTEDIGRWSRGEVAADEIIGIVKSWANARREVEAVVWTALGPKFAGNDGSVPTPAQVIRHLWSLAGDERAKAEEYVRKAPAQIRTEYRQEIERELGWTPTNW